MQQIDTHLDVIIGSSPHCPKSHTHATNPPRNATGPPPISRIFRWQESNSDVRACGGEDAWLCKLMTPPAPAPVGPCPMRWAGERSISLPSLLGFCFCCYCCFHYHYH